MLNSHSGILATDLDGTLIPLADIPENCSDLAILKHQIEEHQVTLCYVTGRHFASVDQAIQEHQLPTPSWLICDVGTTLHRRDEDSFTIVEEYREHLRSLTVDFPLTQLRNQLSDLPQLRLQEDEKQGEFKLSYYVEQNQLRDTTRALQQRLQTSRAPYSLIESIDPFNGDGLVDLLPHNVSKAYALTWWSRHLNYPEEQIVFAGDSGNDLAAFLSGFRSIIVGNADDAIGAEVTAQHHKLGWKNRLYRATRKATSGVLEGCRHFGILPPRLA